MNDPIKLGIVGGCLGTPRHVKLSQVYHRQLVRRLRDEQRVFVSVALAGYSECDELISQVRRLVDVKRAKIVLVQVRPLPLVRNGWLLWWRSDGARKHRLAVHPAVLDRTRIAYDRDKLGYGAAHDVWRHDPTGEKPDRPAPSQWRRWLTKSNINCVAGAALGLHGWARRQLIEALEEAHGHCLRRDARLIVMGPISIPIMPAAELVLGGQVEHLERAMRQARIPFVDVRGDVDEEGLTLFGPDAQHPNPRGHARLAGRLLPVIADLARMTSRPGSDDAGTIHAQSNW
jgi:hypothetical protein